MNSDRIIGHIERLREKPEHVRHHIALATAVGITGIVTASWLVAMTTSGTFALKSNAVSSEAAATVDAAAKTFGSESDFSNLLGAAGAAFGATSTEAALQIIESETRTSSTFDTAGTNANATDKTVIPF